MNQKEAIEAWNAATGGSKDSPATAFAGVVAALGAPKYIPVYGRDFTAGNNTVEWSDAAEALHEWAKRLRGEP